jgi:hypothetical protein
VLNYAAYFAEIYRGGIEANPLCYEAALVLGFSGGRPLCAYSAAGVHGIIRPSQRGFTLVRIRRLRW